MDIKTVKFDKPIYLGATILDLSKQFMYEFYYNVVCKKWWNNDIIYSDTDSLILNIYTNDLYKDLESMKDEFDFSKYPKDHKLYSVDNKSVVGKFKDETHSKPIKEIICLKSKVYF